MNWLRRKLFNWVSNKIPSNRYSYLFYAYIYMKTKPKENFDYIHIDVGE